jgi:hypothetical protein
VPLGDHVRLGLSMTHQVAENRAGVSGASGLSRTRAAVARLDADVGSDVRLAAAFAYGGTSFAGSRAVPLGVGGSSAQLGAAMPMAGADAAVSWAMPTGGRIGVALGSRFAWRHVGLGAVAETGTAGLALAATGGRHERLDVAAGAQVSLAEQARGSWRLSGQLGAELVRRLGGAPELARVSFRDMPELMFDLESGRAPLARLGLTAGFNLRHEPSGARFTLGAGRGDARSPSSFTTGAAIGFDF